MLLKTPREFSFQLCIDLLKRSPKELLHQLRENGVVKALRIGDQVTIFSVTPQKNILQITFLSKEPNEAVKQLVTAYVREWFDLDTDLKPFYRMAKSDRLLKDLIAPYYGYRIVGQPDLFESLIWAVLGQQINLGFAYTLKQRFVQTFGERLALDDHEYFLFPTPDFRHKVTKT